MAITPDVPCRHRARSGCENVGVDPPAAPPRIPRPRGRPTKLTAEVHQAIVGLLRRGATLKDAALSQGVAHSTVLEWMARGECTDPDRAPEPRYAAFAEDVRQGAASARVVASTRLFEENPGRWRAVGTALDLSAFCISAGPEVVVSSFIPIHLQSGVAALGPVPTSSRRRRASSCRCPY